MKYPFNVITARGGWDGRDLPAVRDHRGGLHGLVHPRVLCQVSLQSQQGETLDMFFFFRLFFVSDRVCTEVDEHSRPFGNLALLHIPRLLQVLPLPSTMHFQVHLLQLLVLGQWSNWYSCLLGKM